MSYNPGVPQPPDLPKDNQDDFFMNFGSLNTTFNQDHVPFVGVITNIQQTNPCIVTSPIHTLFTGDMVTFQSLNNSPPQIVTGMQELITNGPTYTITVIDENNFSLNGVDATGYTAYIPSSGLGNYSSASLANGFHKKVTFPYVVDQDPLLANQVGALYPKFQNPSNQIADLYYQNASLVKLLTHLPFDMETVNGRGIKSPWGLIFNFGQVKINRLPLSPSIITLPIPYKSFYTIVGSLFVPSFGPQFSARFYLNQSSLTQFSAQALAPGLPNEAGNLVPIYYMAIGQ